MASADAVENLIQSGLFRRGDQMASKIFLQRLVCTRGSLAKNSVGAFRDVFDLHTRHGAIVALLAL